MEQGAAPEMPCTTQTFLKLATLSNGIMAVDIHRLIAAIRPEVYCETVSRKKVTKIVASEAINGRSACLKAAKVALPRESNAIDLPTLEELNPFTCPGFRSPIERHQITFDDLGRPLEGLYFWLLDYMTDTEGWKVSKLVDNLALTPTTDLHSNMLQQTVSAQNEVMRILRAAQNVLDEILKLAENLKAEKEWLIVFEQARSEDPASREDAVARLHILQQSELGRRTKDSFEVSPTAFGLDGDKGKIEEDEEPSGTAAVLGAKLSFDSWLNASEAQLRMRYQIDKVRGRTLLNSLKLYARWLQPLLRATNHIGHPGQKNASAISGFNTALIELILTGEENYPVHENIQQGVLPKSFGSSDCLQYVSVVVIEVAFRAVPEKHRSGGFGYTGRADVTFTSYGLRADELKVISSQLEQDALTDLMAFSGSNDTEDFQRLFRLIEEIMEDAKVPSLDKQSNGDNPFSVIFSSVASWFRPKEEAAVPSENPAMPLPKDSFKGSVVRSQAILRARRNCQRLYHLFKASVSGTDTELTQMS